MIQKHEITHNSVEVIPDDNSDIPERNKGEASSEFKIRLIEHIFATKAERMAELTNLPLDQITNCAMITTFMHAVKQFCMQLVRAQAWWSKNYAQYHKGADVVDVLTDPDFNLEKLVLLPEEYLYYYYQVRRSAKGDHLMAAVTLGQEQIASESQQGGPMDVDSW